MESKDEAGNQNKNNDWQEWSLIIDNGRNQMLPDSYVSRVGCHFHPCKCNSWENCIFVIIRRFILFLKDQNSKPEGAGVFFTGLNHLLAPS